MVSAARLGEKSKKTVVSVDLCVDFLKHRHGSHSHRQRDGNDLVSFNELHAYEYVFAFVSTAAV
jgi:hypothetical protein